MREIKYRPIGFWPLGSGLQDYSGNGNTATTSGATIPGPALVGTVLHSTRTNGETVEYPVTVPEEYSYSAYVDMSLESVTEGDSQKENLVMNPLPDTDGDTESQNMDSPSETLDGGVPSGQYLEFAATTDGPASITVSTDYLYEGLYYFSFWAASSEDELDVVVEGAQVLSAQTITTTATLTEYSGYFRVSTPGQVQIGLGIEEALIGDTISISSLSISTEPGHTYLDGEMTDHYWTGIAHNSSSKTDDTSTKAGIIGTPTEGLYLSGRSVVFKSNYADGEVVTQFNMMKRKKIHVVATHSKDNDTLFVDGVKVAESPISPLLRNSSLILSSPESGWGGVSVGLNNVAVYPHILSEEVVKNIYKDTVLAPTTSYSDYDLSSEARNIVAQFQLNEGSQWERGTLGNVVVVGDEIEAKAGMTGLWYYTETLDVGVLEYLRFDWDGTATAEVSFDGSSWSPIDRNDNAVTPGFDSTDETVSIRFTFTDADRLRNLSMEAASGNDVTDESERDIVITDAVSLPRTELLQYPEENEIELAVGSVEFGQEYEFNEEGTPTPVAGNTRTLELWYRGNISVSGPEPHTETFNGDQSSAFDAGWNLLHAVFDEQVITNLETNPSFETAATSWSPFAGATQELSTDHALFGTQSLRFERTATGSIIYGVHDIAPLLSGTGTYTVVAGMYVPAFVTGDTSFWVAGTGVTNTVVPVTARDEWQQVSHTFEWDGVGGVFLDSLGPDKVGDEHWVDGIMIVAGDVAPDYFDGDTTDTESDTFVWTGTANASTSQKTQGAVNTFTISGSGSVARIREYNTALTAQEIEDIYRIQVASVYIEESESLGLTLTEPNGEQQVYEEVWTIKQSG